MGRKQNDVFVLGDESLIAEPIVSRDPAAAATTDVRSEDGGSPLPSPARPAGLPTGATIGARGLAVLGLGAAAAATLGALEFSSSTGSAHSQGDRTSSRSALFSRQSPSSPAPGAQPAPTRPVDPQSRPGHRSALRPPRAAHRSEPEREPHPEEAPVSSPVEASAPTSAPSVSPAPSPPSPPPPPSGGGSGAREQFGFER